MSQKYAKYDGGNVIWEVSHDEDGTVDISIDDIQGDIMVCDVILEKLEYVEKEEYDKRINKLKEDYENTNI